MEHHLEQTGEIVMYQPDETIRLEVRMEGETVWLTQAQMAELFHSSRTNIVEHIQHIYEDEELEKEPTCRIFRQVRQTPKPRNPTGAQAPLYLFIQIGISQSLQTPQ